MFKKELKMKPYTKAEKQYQSSFFLIYGMNHFTLMV